MVRRKRLKESEASGDGGGPAEAKARTKPGGEARDQTRRAHKAQKSRKGEMRKVHADFGGAGQARKFLVAGDWSAEAYERVLFKPTIAMPREANGEEILEMLARASGILSERSEQQSG